MYGLKVLVFVISCGLTTYCFAQSYNSYRYPAQRRAGYSYDPAYSNRASAYYNSNTPSNSYYSKSNTYSPYSKNSYNPSTTASYGGQSSSNAVRGYSSQGYSSGGAVRGYSSSPYSSSSYTPKQRYSSSTGYSSNSAPVRSNAANTYSNSKDYLSNSYDSNYKETNSKDRGDATGKKRVSQADAENAKFVGADNQENVKETGRTALRLKRRKLLRQQGYGGRFGSPCSPYGRDAAAGGNGKSSATPPPKEQGRFLWDVNVYNVFPQSYGGGISHSPVGGCGGFGGGLASDYGAPLYGGGGGGFGGGSFGGGGGGLLSDPIPPVSPALTSFLGLWAPGILQNSLAAPAPPRPYADYRPLPDNRPLADNRPLPHRDQEQDDDLQSDPDVDPNYRPPPPVRRPTPVYYDSAGAAPITPGQLVGGVATTVNGIIQQLTGNVQPVYG